jgi:cold shock CspA family protein
MYLSYTELDLGFNNAENYRKRENRALLEKYFVRDEFLDDLLDGNIYYLVGEKGTGKTAYATFISNTEYKGNKSTLYDVRQTEYLKFLELKRRGHLPLTEYPEVWRTLLLIAAATTIIEKVGTPEFFARFSKVGALQKVVDDFYAKAFAPEIAKLISLVEQSEKTASLYAKHLGAGSSIGIKTAEKVEDSNTVFQLNLMKIRKQTEDVLSSIKLDSNIIIFIDGIDVRPPDIAYEDYFDCVRALIHAVWAINNDFLANIKDSKGRIRVVLLVRPDIFLRTGLHNVNTKLSDNSVYLDWATTYKDYRSSLLFRVADRLLAAQQGGTPRTSGEAWDYYFPFFAENVRLFSEPGMIGVNSFLAFLRFSYHRPRDISSMMSVLQKIIKKKREGAAYVTSDDFNDPTFRDAYANYLLGEIKDQLLFYYSHEEYDLFLQFFPHLRGKRTFTYSEFLDAFNEFVTDSNEARKQLPRFFENADVFLQFLFEQNVICYKEIDDSGQPGAKVFMRWCFRERNLTNPSPQVRNGVEYEIFYGLSKALNVGRVVRVRGANTERMVGTVISLDTGKGFGFIRGGPKQTEYYFKVSEFKPPRGGQLRVSDKVSFTVQIKYGKPRACAIARIR